MVFTTIRQSRESLIPPISWGVLSETVLLDNSPNLSKFDLSISPETSPKFILFPPNGTHHKIRDCIFTIYLSSQTLDHPSHGNKTLTVHFSPLTNSLANWPIAPLPNRREHVPDVRRTNHGCETCWLPKLVSARLVFKPRSSWRQAQGLTHLEIQAEVCLEQLRFGNIT